MRYAVLVLLLLGACKLPITTQLFDAEGNLVATARYSESNHGVIISLDGKNLPPGIHGFHIHDAEECDLDAPGSHYNPTGKLHGLRNLKGAHAGDLPNIRIKDDGTVHLDAAAPVKMKEIYGKTLIIKEGVDDQKTDPDGTAGVGIACGVITRLPA